jgi:hypothetical protein
MSATNKVICIDTGRQCGFSGDVGCTHTVTLFRQDGNWEFLGLKARGDILNLHKVHALEPHPHFLDVSSAGGLVYKQ